MRARSWLAGAFIGLAVAVAPPAALGQAPAEDSVTGSATDCNEFVTQFCFHPFSVQLDARSGPNGENPSGTAQWEWVFGSTSPIGFGGPVSCLAVTGNTAIVGVGSGLNVRTLIRLTDGGDLPGQDSFEAVTDASFPGGSGVPAPDCSFFPPTPAPLADVRVGRGGVNDLGNIVVVDSAALPTAKAQCKNGGWKNYGDTFKNQGQCVAFVERGPKP